MLPKPPLRAAADDDDAAADDDEPPELLLEPPELPATRDPPFRPPPRAPIPTTAPASVSIPATARPPIARPRHRMSSRDASNVGMARMNFRICRARSFTAAAAASALEGTARRANASGLGLARHGHSGAWPLVSFSKKPSADLSTAAALRRSESLRQSTELQLSHCSMSASTFDHPNRAHGNGPTRRGLANHVAMRKVLKGGGGVDKRGVEDADGDMGKATWNALGSRIATR